MASQNEMESQPSASPPSSSASPQPAHDSHEPADDRFGRLNWILFVCGALMMALGYIVLALAGREAAGVAGKSAPLAIVGGLLVFGSGFFPRAKPRP